MNNETSGDEVLTVADIVAERGVNKSTVSRWISRYGLIARIAGKKTYLINRSDLESFLESRERKQKNSSQPS